VITVLQSHGSSAGPIVSVQISQGEGASITWSLQISEQGTEGSKCSFFKKKGSQCSMGINAELMGQIGIHNPPGDDDGPRTAHMHIGSLPHPHPFFLCVSVCESTLPHGRTFGLWAFIIAYAGSKLHHERSFQDFC